MATTKFLQKTQRSRLRHNPNLVPPPQTNENTPPPTTSGADATLPSTTSGADTSLPSNTSGADPPRTSGMEGNRLYPDLPATGSDSSDEREDQEHHDNLADYRKERTNVSGIIKAINFSFDYTKEILDTLQGMVDDEEDSGYEPMLKLAVDTKDSATPLFAELDKYVRSKPSKLKRRSILTKSTSLNKRIETWVTYVNDLPDEEEDIDPIPIRPPRRSRSSRVSFPGQETRLYNNHGREYQSSFQEHSGGTHCLETNHQNSTSINSGRQTAPRPNMNSTSASGEQAAYHPGFTSWQHQQSTSASGNTSSFVPQSFGNPTGGNRQSQNSTRRFTNFDSRSRADIEQDRLDNEADFFQDLPGPWSVILREKDKASPDLSKMIERGNFDKFDGQTINYIPWRTQFIALVHQHLVHVSTKLQTMKNALNLTNPRLKSMVVGMAYNEEGYRT